MPPPLLRILLRQEDTKADGFRSSHPAPDDVYRLGPLARDRHCDRSRAARANRTRRPTLNPALFRVRGFFPAQFIPLDQAAHLGYL
jgi:hypothetical protein